MPTPITDADFNAKVLSSPLPVVMDFWAPWCGPCRAMLPIVEEVEQEMVGKVTFVKMNVDENQEIPEKFGVMSIPTFIIFKNGEAVKNFVGAKSKEDFVSIINSIL